MNRSMERKFTNKVYLGQVQVRPVSGASLPSFGGTFIAANAINVNRGGLSLFTSRFLEVGQAVELELGGDACGHCGADYSFSGRVAQVHVETEGNIIDI